MKFILRIVTVLLVTGLVSAFMTQEGFAERSEKEVANIFKNFFKHAEQGNAEAQNLLGEMYFLGKGVTQDYQEAAKWYRKAAEQGRANAQYNLGFMYENGQGVKQDYQEAAKWYRKAAEQGDAYARNLLGATYFWGKGVTQDYQEAAKWYRKAAEQGDANAQYNLGFMYENGQGVIQDRKEAATWYRKAAEQGYAYAQNNLGLLYENGQGVLKDDIMAYALFNLAAVQGNEEARNNRALLKTKMSQDQIAEARRLSRQLLAKIESTINDKATEPDDTATEPDYIIQESHQIKNTGTGFVINTDAHIVTNHHVISDCKRIEIINSTINSRATVLFLDEINDLAVIKSNTPVSSYAFLRGGRGVRVGENIITVGYPLGTILGESVKVTTGNISAVTGFDNDTTIMQITAPIQLGNSGGPVLDMSGNVVGIVSSKINELGVKKATGLLLQNINFAIKSQTLQIFLDAHQIDYKMKNADTKLETADIAEAAQEYTVRVTCYE
jgi:TPR repeat protein